MTTRGTVGKGRMSGLGYTLKSAPNQRLWPASLGQSCPQENPSPEATGNAQNALGEPLSIKGAAAMMGCSAWTIRQRYIPQGLPHLRSGPAGKLIFYRHQIVRWILQQQTRQQTKREKGGKYA